MWSTVLTEIVASFEVALDGNIIAREPNGDVIEMSPPGWQVRAELSRVQSLRQFSILLLEMVVMTGP